MYSFVKHLGCYTTREDKNAVNFKLKRIRKRFTKEVDKTNVWAVTVNLKSGRANNETHAECVLFSKKASLERPRTDFKNKGLDINSIDLAACPNFVL